MQVAVNQEEICNGIAPKPKLAENY